MGYNVVWVERLRIELQKTGVISDDYKSHLVTMALSAYQEGLEDGKREAKGEDVDKRCKRKEKELEAARLW